MAKAKHFKLCTGMTNYPQTGVYFS